MNMNYSNSMAENEQKKDVFTQVTLAGDDRVTVGAVELGHVLCMFLQDVHLHGTTLGEPRMTDITLVRLFP